jgi:tetratricopeptide (TPR) repeat protein
MMLPMEMYARAIVLACLLITMRPAAAVHGQTSPGPPRSGEASSPVAFDVLRRQADEARAAGRVDEAVALYKRAVALQPSWTEGYWYLGTISYDRDRHAECRDAFTRVVQRQSENGAAWAFRGLCEFRLKQYRAALDHLNRARQAGVGDDPAFDAIVAYHRAILFARFGQFERAFDVDVNLVRGGNTMPAMLDAIGIAMLRLPLLPEEVPPEQRDLVRLTGRAGAYGIERMAEEARKAYEELLTRYPDTPGVHFVYGNFLFAQERPDAALEQFRMEIARSPNHVPARLQLALELVKRGDLDAAKPYVTQAVRLAPGNFVARRVLGQIKLQAGDAAGAIAELEAARSLEPSSPSVRFHLARAYQRAGRTVDAKRERGEFTRLEAIQQKQRGAASGAAGEEPVEPLPH